MGTSSHSTLQYCFIPPPPPCWCWTSGYHQTVPIRPPSTKTSNTSTIVTTHLLPMISNVTADYCSHQLLQWSISCCGHPYQFPMWGQQHQHFAFGFRRRTLEFWPWSHGGHVRLLLVLHCQRGSKLCWCWYNIVFRCIKNQYSIPPGYCVAECRVAVEYCILVLNLNFKLTNTRFL